MKKINTYALIILALSLGVALSTKEDLYQEGGANSELYAEASISVIPMDNIVDPDEDNDERPPVKGKKTVSNSLIPMDNIVDPDEDNDERPPVKR